MTGILCSTIRYVVMAWERFFFSIYVLISAPLVLVGVLFLLNWLRRVELRTL